jgi:coenzyme F420 hydrogenase subunit beta
VFGLEQAPRSEFGVYRKLVLARAADEYVRGVAQDGGAVSALLLFALAEGIVDSAIVSGLSHKKPFYPEPKVVKRAEEVLEAAGTRYTGSPNLLPLGQALRRKRKVAFVGTPCQIHAARKIQAANVIGGSTSLKLLIGLMCSERFTYEGLMEKHLQNEIGVELSKIRKINIKGKMEVTTDVGITEIPLADIKQYVEKGCIDCKEFSSELADISVGGLGMKKWTFIIARTEKGEKLLEAAEKSGYLETKIADLDSCEVKLLVRLSRKKARPIRSISGKDTPNSYQREKH